ncbi:hypothetical protein AAD018_014360 [Aestuariibius insulae]|uniref:hypothetical protein n=1 Tax=Aestuariibius insulae TaxID=2058287 RepID=UPI00345EC409
MTGITAPSTEAPPPAGPELDLEQLMALLRMLMAEMNSKGAGLNEPLDALMTEDMTDAVIENAVGDADAEIDVNVQDTAEGDSLGDELTYSDPEVVDFLERYFSSVDQMTTLLQGDARPDSAG